MRLLILPLPLCEGIAVAAQRDHLALHFQKGEQDDRFLRLQPEFFRKRGAVRGAAAEKFEHALLPFGEGNGFRFGQVYTKSGGNVN